MSEVIYWRDPNSNPLDRAWAAWYNFIQDDRLASGIAISFVYNLAFFGTSTFFITISRLPAFEKYKIQKSSSRPLTLRQHLQYLQTSLMEHLVATIVLVWLFHPTVIYFDVSYRTPLSPTRKAIFQICVFLLAEDTHHYWAHRALHWGPLYQRFHRKHHKYSESFWFVAEYASLFEIILIGFGTICFPLLYSKFVDNVHLFTFVVWIFIRVLAAVDRHSGYDLPWSAHQLLPFLVGSVHHDLHHKQFRGNYAEIFRWWDIVLRTEAETMARKGEHS